MTSRLIIWCGYEYRAKALDAATSRSDIEQAIRAARALGIDEIWALVVDREFLPDGFKGHVKPATVAAFRHATRTIADRAGPDDRLLFVATNHCDGDGLLTEGGTGVRCLDEFSDEVDDSILSPDILVTGFDPIPGLQVVLIGACFAGVFASVADERRFVMFSVPAHQKDETYDYDDETHPPRTLFLCEVLSHWSGTSLAGYQPPTACSLEEAYARASAQCPRAGCAGQPRW